MKYKGDIKGFPKHIVEAMLDEQERQGNKRDVTIFEDKRSSGSCIGGFDWNESILGDEVWRDVICDEQFQLIQQPKKERFPFKLKEEDAKRIINIAVRGVNFVLSEKWGCDILLMGYVEVSEEYYKRIREWFNDEQNLLLDEIFGKDEEFIPDGTPCLVTNHITSGWKLRYSDGKGKFYSVGTKKGISDEWNHYQILDINNLPVNE